MNERVALDEFEEAALSRLRAQIAADLERTAHPSTPWLEPKIAPDGSAALDVLIVGGGQSGLATAFGLRRSQVTNVLVIDKAVRGREGPWLTYARMPTLRSPKTYTGPDLDLPSLTYQSWHEARFGAADWARLSLIPTEHWARYLLWFRDVLDLPVRNGCKLVDVSPVDGLLAATLQNASGERQILHARKLVLATGQEGAGRWSSLPLLAALPAHRHARTADAIDFAALRGKVVAVIGAGASAFDNAATALEAGAAHVHLLCRRPKPQVIQPYRWLTFRGILRHLGDLDDRWRWRFMRTVLNLREGFPQQTYDRCARHENFTLHVGAPVEDLRDDGERLALTTPGGTIEADFVISAVGIEIDYGERPELARFASNIATWADRYAPPVDEADPLLARFPYLDADYAFTEKVSGTTPWIRDIHLFAIASTMSFGPSGASINAMTTAVPKLVYGITKGLFAADVERHWHALSTYDVAQAVIDAPAQASVAPRLQTD